MSDFNKPSCSRFHRGASPFRDDKPKHVKSLNFGQSTLKFNTVKQRLAPSHVLLIDENVSRIPYTEKKDYVRKWLESHDRYDSSISSSPLETSATTSSQKSPIIYRGRKRHSRKICINRNAAKKSLSDADCQEHSSSSTLRSEHHGYKEKNENWSCTSETQHTPRSVQNTIEETSPVLETTLRHTFNKKKRRKLQYEPEDSVSPKCSKSHDYQLAGKNIESMTEYDGNLNNLRKIPVDHDKLEEKSNVEAETVWESTEKYQGYIETFLSPTQEKLSLADSSSNITDKNDNIETDTSSDGKNKKHKKLIITPSSTNNSCYFIEDVDTQETVKTQQLSKAGEKLNPLRQQLTSWRLAIDDDLNETFCSEAEIMQDQSTHLSAQISEVPSLNKPTQKTVRSTQTEVISSTITTPSKKSQNRTIYAHLLDSGKKRRKPKKKSMVAKLESLISAQMSDVRIWRHRMSKNYDATSLRYISVFVYNSTKQFGNQFLEGVLLEDPYNLLQSDLQIEEAETANVQAKSEERLRKKIIIMLVCDIVGTLKMISEVVINVYPPWNILDKDILVLEAMYVNISDNSKVPDIGNVKKLCKHKKRILKEFNCPCIEEQRELPFCSRKPNNDKPDVMQQIFNF